MQLFGTRTIARILRGSDTGVGVHTAAGCFGQEYVRCIASETVGGNFYAPY